jgi:hypothetical protein
MCVTRMSGKECEDVDAKLIKNKMRIKSTASNTQCRDLTLFA